MHKLFLTIGAAFAGIAVMAGAFGAHGLKSRVSTDLLNAFEVGVRYQMYHALALMALAWIFTQYPGNPVKFAAYFMIAGTLIFSGSLYILTLSGIKAWGAITPIGGLLLIIGWALLTIGIIKG